MLVLAPEALGLATVFRTTGVLDIALAAALRGLEAVFLATVFLTIGVLETALAIDPIADFLAGALVTALRITGVFDIALAIVPRDDFLGLGFIIDLATALPAFPIALDITLGTLALGLLFALDIDLAYATDLAILAYAPLAIAIPSSFSLINH